MTSTTPSKPNPLWCGLTCRCPSCGEAPLFAGFLKVRARCDGCGQDLSRADSGDGPVVFILLIVGALGCGGLLYTELALGWPVWLELLVWLPLVGLAAVGAIRPFKATLIALQVFNNASQASR